MATKAQKAPEVKLSHPEKIFWPEEGYTKSDLAEFYSDVFALLGPYVKDRILTLERCPDGMGGKCFYQKEMPESMPPGTSSKEIANESGPRKSTHYVVGGSLSTQLALVNLGCIPIHVTGSRASTFPNPDWVCIDLDPGSGKFGDAAKAGLIIKDFLDAADLISFPKTSGSRGMHIFIPIRVGPSAGEVLRFAEEFLAKVAAVDPKLLTVEHSIASRGDRVYLDAMRNGSVQTVVSPYSIRRKPHAPVSTPLDWNEVKTSLDPTKFNLGNFKARIKKKDPWADFFKSRQPLRELVVKLKKI